MDEEQPSKSITYALYPSYIQGTPILLFCTVVILLLEFPCCQLQDLHLKPPNPITDLQSIAPKHFQN